MISSRPTSRNAIHQTVVSAQMIWHFIYNSILMRLSPQSSKLGLQAFVHFRPVERASRPIRKRNPNPGAELLANHKSIVLHDSQANLENRRPETVQTLHWQYDRFSSFVIICFITTNLNVPKYFWIQNDIKTWSIYIFDWKELIYIHFY